MDHATRVIRLSTRADHAPHKSQVEVEKAYGPLRETPELGLDAGLRAWMGSAAVIKATPRGLLLLYTPAARGELMLEQLRRELAQRKGLLDEVVCTPALLQALQQKAGGPPVSGEALRTVYDSQFRGMVTQAMEQGASDLHFRMRNAGGETQARLYLRLDGELELVDDSMSPQQMHELVAAAYAKSDQKSLAVGEGQFNLQVPLSSFIRLPDLRNVELRFQSAPERYGFDATIRVLNFDGRTANYGDLAALGYLPDQQDMLKEHGHGPGGAVLFSGETGSGKTTALNTLLATHPGVQNRTLYASTLEDPPEGRPPNVSQFAVARSATQGGIGESNPFLSALRVRMRSDGDIVVIGEIRDGATAEMFAQLGMTGHKEYASLHAPSCKGAYERLTSSMMGLPTELVASPDVMGLTVYQTLVPRLCPHCRIPAQTAWADALNRRKLHRLSELGLEPSALFVRNYEGCSRCRKGRSGVQVVAEMFAPNEEQRLLISQGRIPEAFHRWRAGRTAALAEPATGGKTAFEVALYFCQQGLLGVDTLDRVVSRILSYEAVRADGQRSQD